ncbi:CU044_5270 family protein [Streptomyces sp. NPDC058200]|uniref:CU044_5270 family protein n=1 Tax=Streptomyces sp. NPDC058200 TaxID=3346378 RepID=UPI0036EEAD5E
MNVFSRRLSSARHEEPTPLPPAPRYPDLSSGRHGVLKERFMEKITQESAPAPVFVPAPVARPSWKRRTALVALPALLVAGAVTVAGVGGVFGESAPTVSAAEHREAVRLLDRIALVAAERPALTVRDDQYVYTKVKGSREFLGKGTDVFEREDWQAVDGRRHGLAREVFEPGSPSIDGGPATRRTVLNRDPNATTYRELAALPTDPAALLEKIKADTNGQGPSRYEGVFEAIGAMLPQSTLIPDLNAALYRATARIPGVVVKDDAVDAAGREGVGLTFRTARGDSVTWVFDRTALTYLGTDKVAALGVGIADSTDQPPA